MKPAPGTGGLKFNIQKRPFAVTSQTFSSTAEGQHGGFGPQPNPEKAQNHRGHLSGKPDDWPQDMKEYVERCFTACESEEDKDRTEKLLKEVLQARLQDGSAYTIDWSREPLPGTTAPPPARTRVPAPPPGPRPATSAAVTPTRIPTVPTQGMSVTPWGAETLPLRAGEAGGPTWTGAEAGRSVGRGMI